MCPDMCLDRTVDLNIMTSVHFCSSVLVSVTHALLSWSDVGSFFVLILSCPLPYKYHVAFMQATHATRMGQWYVGVQLLTC